MISIWYSSKWQLKHPANSWKASCLADALQCVMNKTWYVYTGCCLLMINRGCVKCILLASPWWATMKNTKKSLKAQGKNLKCSLLDSSAKWKPYFMKISSAQINFDSCDFTFDWWSQWGLESEANISADE